MRDVYEAVETTIRDLRTRHLARNPRRRPNTAVDVPTCVWLWQFLTEEAERVAPEPLRVADLGSGFSTVTVRAWRRWAAENGLPEPVTYSTDHEPVWLGATIIDLEEEGLSTDHCMSQDVWEHIQLEPFHVIFVDLNGPPSRVERFDRFHAKLRRDGAMVFDDWHMPHLRTPMSERCRGRNMEPVEVPESVDQYGRFVAVARRAG